MNRGYIKLFRKVEDNILWNSSEQYCKRAAWIDLIMLANHEDNSFLLGSHSFKVKRGQTWTSILKLRERWGWGEKRVNNFLSLLQEEGMAYIEKTNRGVLITLVNYGFYQEKSDSWKEQRKDQRKYQRTEQRTEQRKTQGSTKGGIKGETKAVSKEGAKAVQTIMIKNDIKNVKNDIKNEKESPTGDYVDF